MNKSTVHFSKLTRNWGICYKNSAVDSFLAFEEEIKEHTAHSKIGLRSLQILKGVKLWRQE